MKPFIDTTTREIVLRFDPPVICSDGESAVKSATVLMHQHPGELVYLDTDCKTAAVTSKGKIAKRSEYGPLPSNLTRAAIGVIAGQLAKCDQMIELAKKDLKSWYDGEQRRINEIVESLNLTPEQEAEMKESRADDLSDLTPEALDREVQRILDEQN